MRIPNAPNAVVKPIAVGEFAEALRAVCPARPLPPLWRPRREQVSVACSGGVDSMALMYLLARLRQTQPDFMLGRASLGTVNALIVDHQIRAESHHEARLVARTISERLGWGGYVRPLVLLISWSQLLGRRNFDLDSLAAQPNIEQLARTGRFRALAKACRWRDTMRLFLAHHEDDDYETVLLRMAMGYTGAGLQGIQPVASIPECDEMYGCSKSGLGDGGVGGGEEGAKLGLRALRLRAMEELERMDQEEEGSDDQVATVDTGPDYGMRPEETAHCGPPGPHLPKILVEDHGISVYRPLLKFSKARLMATCEAAGIPWVDDPSNDDVTLTPRNALRYICKHHVLPVALQKPSVLGMARSLKLSYSVVAAEARRTLVRYSSIKHFCPNTGIVLVDFPDVLEEIKPRRRPTSTASLSRSQEWARRRKIHCRQVAAAMLRSAIALVTPDAEHPSLSSLEHLVSIVLGPNHNPKAFTHSHVLFTPITPADAGPSPLKKACSGGRTRWQLSRQLPIVRRPGDVPWRFFRIHNNTSPMSDDERLLPVVRRWWAGQSESPITSSSPSSAPSTPSPAVPSLGSLFAMPSSLLGASELPPSVPLTLPKLSEPPMPSINLLNLSDPYKASSPWYAHSFNQFQLWDNRYWIRVRTRLCGVFGIAPPTPSHLSHFRAALSRTDDARLAHLLRMHAPGKTRYTLPALYVVWDRRWGGGWRREWGDGVDVGEGVTLVALPSFGVELPGLSGWLQCEVRYMKVDLME